VIIGLDLTWLSPQSGGGGINQYSMRVLTALVRYSHHSVVGIISEGYDCYFSDLKGATDFKLLIKSSSKSFSSIVEEENIQVIHTPFQQHVNFTLAVPMITTLHDLQPFYYPEFFTPEEIEYRNVHYRKSAEFSERVIVSYQHVKDDLVKFYNISPEKIDICGHGMAEAEPVTADQVIAIKNKYQLPESYLFYSANTWRHKNHIGLLRALKIVHEKYGVKVPLICTGFQNPEFFPQIEAEIRRLALSDSVRFLGYLPEEEIPALLCGATLSVIPTLYEAGSFPLMEAMNYGVPVICAATTSLPDTIGDLRFVFDPNSPEDVADKIVLMLTNEQMRTENISNSVARVIEWRWEKAVQPFLACYQRAIDGFVAKKKNLWYSDWAVNYEFMAMKVESKLRRELGLYSDELARTRAELEHKSQQIIQAEKNVEAVKTSMSWRLSTPLRKVLDLVKRIIASKSRG